MKSIVSFVRGLVITGKFFLTERIITVATRIFTDVPMLYFILRDDHYGWLHSLVFVTPVYILVCMAIVSINDLFYSRNIDITGIEEMRLIAHSTPTKYQFFKRFIKWFMQRRATIFWIGSFYYLDPDYVTLLLRKEGDSFMKTTLRITIPSVFISMIFWTSVYWALYQVFKEKTWAIKLVEFIETSPYL